MDLKYKFFVKLYLISLFIGTNVLNEVCQRLSRCENSSVKHQLGPVNQNGHRIQSDCHQIVDIFIMLSLSMLLVFLFIS